MKQQQRQNERKQNGRIINNNGNIIKRIIKVISLVVVVYCFISIGNASKTGSYGTERHEFQTQRYEFFQTQQAKQLQRTKASVCSEMPKRPNKFNQTRTSKKKHD